MNRTIVASYLALAAGIGLYASPAQAATPSDPTQTALATAMGQVATSFVQEYWSQWSLPNAQAMPYMRQDFASTVNFFGKEISRDAMLKNTRDFAERWQIRNYTITPHDAAHPNRGITSVNCNVANSTCVVSGVVHWDAQAPGPRLHSQGDAKFSFTLALNGGQTLITAETSSVVWRKLSPLSQVAATAPPSNNEAQQAQATPPTDSTQADQAGTINNPASSEADSNPPADSAQSITTVDATTTCTDYLNSLSLGNIGPFKDYEIKMYERLDEARMANGKQPVGSPTGVANDWSGQVDGWTQMCNGNPNMQFSEVVIFGYQMDSIAAGVGQ
ncbi:MAG: hypothetical protein P4L77_10555 [Sulfuriferula sp.]|nr:hypothetical protein [Sulfuriferula sp.]